MLHARPFALSAQPTPRVLLPGSRGPRRVGHGCMMPVTVRGPSFRVGLCSRVSLRKVGFGDVQYIFQVSRAGDYLHFCTLRTHTEKISRVRPVVRCARCCGFAPRSMCLGIPLSCCSHHARSLTSFGRPLEFDLVAFSRRLFVRGQPGVRQLRREQAGVRRVRAHHLQDAIRRLVKRRTTFPPLASVSVFAGCTGGGVCSDFFSGAGWLVLHRRAGREIAGTGCSDGEKHLRTRLLHRLVLQHGPKPTPGGCGEDVRSRFCLRPGTPASFECCGGEVLICVALGAAAGVRISEK